MVGCLHDSHSPDLEEDKQRENNSRRQKVQHPWRWISEHGWRWLLLEQTLNVVLFFWWNISTVRPQEGNYRLGRLRTWDGVERSAVVMVGQKCHRLGLRPLRLTTHNTELQPDSMCVCVCVTKYTIIAILTQVWITNYIYCSFIRIINKYIIQVELEIKYFCLSKTDFNVWLYISLFSP